MVEEKGNKQTEKTKIDELNKKIKKEARKDRNKNARLEEFNEKLADPNKKDSGRQSNQ